MKANSLTSRGDYLLKKYESVVLPIDLFTARFLGAKSSVESESIFDLAIVLCVALRSNQVSLSRSQIQGKNLSELLESLIPGLQVQIKSESSGTTTLFQSSSDPEFRSIDLDKLIKSDLFYVLPNGKEPTDFSVVNTPFVVSGEWIYFRRQWVSEWYILKALESRLDERFLVSEDQFSNKLNDLFYDEFGHSSGQVKAALTANRYPFSIITGGPGTGKTRTIVGFLASVFTFKPEINVLLCAPTGKAASRMVESIQSALESDVRLNTFSQIIPQHASTIHRMLGWNPSTGTFRHHEANPIKADLLIVDEASMIDLVMFSRLMRAISSDCRIVLIGDKDQLASVEAGSIFGDLIRAGLSGQSPRLQNTITKLTHSWRFNSDSGLGLLAESINNGEADPSWEAINSDSGSIKLSQMKFGDTMFSRIKNRYDVILSYTRFEDTSISRKQISKSADKALDKLAELQILTAHRTGNSGSVFLNRSIDQQLSSATSNEWYVGRPVIATGNDYDNGIFNGDMGITVQIGSDFWVYFGIDENKDEVRLFKPSQLGQMESAWVLTVHKSQGSEYKEVLLVLPDYESPVLSRELLYTAVTRAKESVLIVAQKSVWTYAVKSTLYKEGGFLNRLSL